MQSTVVDENGGRCRNVGQTTDGLAGFLYVHPCPASVSADVPFDTTRVANGSHHLLVSVIDAAGNAAPVLDRQITIANPPPPGPANGTNASSQASLSVSWKGTRKGQITRAYGRSATVDGRLTAPGGAPISGRRHRPRRDPRLRGREASRGGRPAHGQGRAFQHARVGRNLIAHAAVRLPQSSGRSAGGDGARADAVGARGHPPERRAAQRERGAEHLLLAGGCSAGRSRPPESSSCSRRAPPAAPGSSST